MNFAGIDAGSRSIKVVIVDQAKRILATAVAPQGVRQEQLASRLLSQALKKSGLTPRKLARIVATGYGRDSLSMADTTITEITCHACGVNHLMPGTRTVIDIGGQDSKVLKLDESGKVLDFMMNDRCAAGTGRFLEVVADRLGIGLKDFGKLARLSRKPASISSMCVVFAESEIVGLLASGENARNIAAGVQASIMTRVASLAGSSLRGPIVFTGGVALIPGMTLALSKALVQQVQTAKFPQLTGALGAAIIAERVSP